MEDFDHGAAKWGIDSEYVDARGQRQFVTVNALRRIAHALEAGGVSPQDLGQAFAVHRAYQGRSDATLWLLAVQLYSIRSARNWGHGDFTDLAALLEMAGELGAAGIGLNPLHALFPDRPEQASPYAPNSRLFLNPLYIDVEQVPEFPGVSAIGLDRELARARHSGLVAYADVGRIKMAALRLAYRAFVNGASPNRHAEFADFRRQQGATLARFAAFETLRAQFGAVRSRWPPQWRRPDAETLQALRAAHADELGFHEFVQWVADSQLRACKELAQKRGLSIGLYLDVAVGIDPEGADAWAEPDSILRDLSIGAPPDILNTAGQDWGITGFNPHALVAQDFAPFRSLLSCAMRHAGAIRLDHILGLKRLYVIPRGLGSKEGAYLRYPLDALLSVIAEESESYRCIVIGEDLGTVPEGFRETLASWGIWSYLVMLFERDGDGFRAPERYPVTALSTFATHDLPTFGGWMRGSDLRAKRAIGLDPGETQAEREAAQQAMRNALAQRDAEADFAGVVRFLAATPSRLVVISIEDVLGVEDQINVPGTTDEHPNWRRRLPVSLEQIRENDVLKRVAEIFTQMGRRDPRR